jgi:hypothetical protein
MSNPDNKTTDNKVTLTGKNIPTENKPNNGILFLPNIWDEDDDDDSGEWMEDKVDEYDDDEYDY